MDNSLAREANDIMSSPWFKAMAEYQSRIDKMVNPPLIKAMAEYQSRIDKMVNPPLIKAIAEFQSRIDKMVNPPLIKAMAEYQSRIDKMVNPPLIKAITDYQNRINETINPVWLNTMAEAQKRVHESLKTLSLSSLDYAIANMPVLDNEEAEKFINDEPPILTFEEKQDITNCVDIVTGHGPNWEYSLASKAQSFKHDHPKAYAVLLSIILPILINLFCNWLYDTIKVKLNPSANAPIIQEVPVTNIVIIDRSHNYYYEVEFPSDDGKELKRGWVGKARLNEYLKEIQKEATEKKQ